MQLKLKILEDNATITNSILTAMLPEVTSYMNNGVNLIKQKLPLIIQVAIIDTPEYESILSGQLKYEFGIPNSSSKLAGLLNIWSSNILYTYNKPSITGNKITASFSAQTIKADFSDVLYTDYASMTDSLRGYSLPWLEWLLLEGNKIIISKYNVVMGPNKFSRTGEAVMAPSNKSWKVPSQFSGTISDNWITRAIDNAEADIKTLLAKAFE